MYSAGNRFRISLFGKSHAECVGCVIEGLPPGMVIDMTHLSGRMRLRKPSDGIGTSRREQDEVVFGYGVRDGVVTSGTVMLTIRNENRDSTAYDEFKTKPRPGHADLPALMKFEDFDIRGGGQFSGRMTAPMVVAGALAEQVLESSGIRIAACARSIGSVSDGSERAFEEIRGSAAYPTRACTDELDRAMYNEIEKAERDGDSVGGVVGCMIDGLNAGFGGIWFNALDSTLARMMFSIPGVKGVGFGKGFGIAKMRGSESNDPYTIENGGIRARTNNMGGICGGMCDGMPVTFDVAFKPTPSISREQDTVDLSTMTDCRISIRGRHDPCIVPRAVAVVEAMAAITVLDQKMSF